MHTDDYMAYLNRLDDLHHRLISLVAEFYGFTYFTSRNPDTALDIYDGYDAAMQHIEGIYKSLHEEFSESFEYPENIDAP